MFKRTLIGLSARVQLIIWLSEVYAKSYGQTTCYNISYGYFICLIYVNTSWIISYTMCK